MKELITVYHVDDGGDDIIYDNWEQVIEHLKNGEYTEEYDEIIIKIKKMTQEEFDNLPEI